jgi:DNA modification methylase
VVFDRTAGEALDQQSGRLATNKPVKWKRERETAEGRRVASSYAFTPFESGEIRSAYSDSGGASRFFTQADFGPDDWPFVYQAKPSRKERNAGLDGLPKQRTKSYEGGDIVSADHPETAPGGSKVAANHHPTVKPVALMRYLVRLVTPPGGTVLDPFAGSGTTLVAAVLEGFDAIGCEMTDEYLPIIEGRVAWAEEQAFIREELEKLTPKQERLL